VNIEYGADGPRKKGENIMKLTILALAVLVLGLGIALAADDNLTLNGSKQSVDMQIVGDCTTQGSFIVCREQPVGASSPTDAQVSLRLNKGQAIEANKEDTEDTDVEEEERERDANSG
jgi:hypothetical protein